MKEGVNGINIGRWKGERRERRVGEERKGGEGRVGGEKEGKNCFQWGYRAHRPAKARVPAFALAKDGPDYNKNLYISALLMHQYYFQ